MKALQKIHFPRANTLLKSAVCDRNITPVWAGVFYATKKADRCQSCETIARKIDGVEFDRRVKRFGGEL